MPELKQGHRRYVYHDPRPADGKWITDASIHQTDGDVTLSLGGSTPAPGPKILRRSIPCFSSGTVDFLIAEKANLHLGPDGDVILLAIGGGARALTDANMTWITQQAAKVRAALPGNLVYGHTSGLKDVKRMATSAALDGVNFNWEPGFGTESEPFTTNQATNEARIREGKSAVNAQGKHFVISPSGRYGPVRKEGGVQWDYGAFEDIVKPSLPNVIQTQREFEAQANEPDKADWAHRFFVYMRDNCPTFWPQITVNLGEVNGVTAAKGLSVLKAVMASSGWRPDGISVWSSASTAGEFRAFLAGTKNL